MKKIFVFLLFLVSVYSQPGNSLSNFYKSQFFPVMAWAPEEGKNEKYEFISGTYPDVMHLKIFVASDKKITSLLWSIKKDWLFQNNKINPFFEPLFPLFLEECVHEKDEYYYSKIKDILDSLINKNLLPFSIIGYQSFLIISEEGKNIVFQIFDKKLLAPPRVSLLKSEEFYRWDSLLGAKEIKNFGEIKTWLADSLNILEQRQKSKDPILLLRKFTEKIKRSSPAEAVYYKVPDKPFHRIFIVNNKKILFITLEKGNVVFVEFSGKINFERLIKIL